MLRTVKTENGLVRGLAAADPRITAFRGIPFAEPPVGENRWRAPRPARDWEGILNAYDFGPASMQAPCVVDPNNIYCREWAVDPDLPMSEDCLYLNVWTPACRGDEKLPVFVWFFGGGLQGGHPAEMEFDGERIARRGIVVVTVNYRTNVFGFLCHPEISREAPEAPANFGHLDQRFGIRWVKRNIEVFGGDPGNVTIGGQSAGGGSVLTQMNSPQNEGLFQKAIIESGIIVAAYPHTPMPVPGVELREAEKKGEEFFRFLGVSSLAEARALDAEYVRDKMLRFPGGPFGTVIDHRFCVENDYTLLMEGKKNRIPLLLGNTEDEFCAVPRVKSREELEALAKELLGAEAEEYMRLCPREQPFEEALDRVRVNGIEYTIRLLAQRDRELGREGLMYYYRFAAEIPGWDHPGTFHSVDLWFFFETLAKCWRPFTGKHYDLSRLMCNYWANFIRSGDPNGRDADGERMPEWEPFTADTPCGMRFADRAESFREEPQGAMALLLGAYRGV